MTTNNLLVHWEEGRTRFVNILNVLTEQDMQKRIVPSPNSIGFLVRHIGDVEMLFAKNVFQLKEIQVHAKTVISQRDTGEWTSFQQLRDYVENSGMVLKRAILQMKEENWEKEITTKEFGTKTLAEALGRITTHTAWHAGQIAIILKYGSLE